MIGHTPGGSPIFLPRVPRKHGPQGKTMHACSVNEGHRLTVKQAKSSGFMCTHCGADLKVRKQKISELQALARSLGFDLIPKEPIE